MRQNSNMTTNYANVRQNLSPQKRASIPPPPQTTAPNPPEESPYSMTEQLLRERLQRPVYGHLPRQIYAGFLACLASLSFGTALGWTNSVSQHGYQVKTDQSTSSEVSWLISIMLLGCSLGVTSSSLLMRQMGPKKVLQAVGPFYIFNWWITLVPQVNVQMAGRFFLGFLGMSYSNAGENLLIQTIDFGLRRYITVLYNSMMIMGVFISRVIAAATTTFWLTVICASFPILHYALIQVVPESPVFLYAGGHELAAKSLAWYRGEGNFYMDMANIKKDWDASRQDSDAYQYMLFSRVVYRPLLVVMCVVFFQICAGYLIFMFYTLEALTDGKVVFSPFADSCIFAIYFVFTKMLWGYLHTRFSWKVRGFLISSCLFTSASLGLFSLYLLLNQYDIDLMINTEWNLLVIAFFFLFSYDMGLNHFSKILIFEYMPFQMYKNTYLVIQAEYWLLSFVNIYTFATTFERFHSYTYFAVLSCLTFLGSLFCYFFVVETKGKSLIQLQLQFGGNPIGTRGALYHQIRQTL